MNGLHIKKCDDFIAGGSLHFFLPYRKIKHHEIVVVIIDIDSSRQRVASVAQFGFVAVFPDFGQNHGGIKAEKDAERKRDLLDDGPGVKPEELLLNRTLLHFGHFEGEQDPHGQVAQEQEGDHLAAGFAGVLVGRGNPPALRVRDEQELQHHLETINVTC